VSLKDNSAEWQEKECQFDFVFIGRQNEAEVFYPDGFFDKEIISSTIKTGLWGAAAPGAFMTQGVPAPAAENFSSPDSGDSPPNTESFPEPSIIIESANLPAEETIESETEPADIPAEAEPL